MFSLTLSMLDRIVFLVIGLLALVACFGGSRLLRFWLALAGFQAGLYLGLNFGVLLFPVPVHQLILAIIAGVVLGGLFSIFARVGSLLAGAGVMLLLADQLMRQIPLPSFEPYRIYVYLALALLGVVPGVLQFRPFLILASALNGGWLASFCGGGFIAAWALDQAAARYNLLQGGPSVLVLVGTTVLMIMGAWTQFALARRRGPAERQVKDQQMATIDKSATPLSGLVLPALSGDQPLVGDRPAGSEIQDEPDKRHE